LACCAGGAGPIRWRSACWGPSYQVYRLSYHFSLGLLLLTIFDAAIVGLTWREYTQAAGEER
jgi:hypothetical protein